MMCHALCNPPPSEGACCDDTVIFNVLDRLWQLGDEGRQREEPGSAAG